MQAHDRMGALHLHCYMWLDVESRALLWVGVCVCVGGVIDPFGKAIAQLWVESHCLLLTFIADMRCSGASSPFPPQASSTRSGLQATPLAFQSKRA